MKRHHVYCPEPVASLEARWVPSHGGSLAGLAARAHAAVLMHPRIAHHPLTQIRAVRLPRGAMAALLSRPATSHGIMPAQNTALDPPAPGTGTTGVLTPPGFMNCIDMNPDILDPNDVCAPG